MADHNRQGRDGFDLLTAGIFCVIGFIWFAGSLYLVDEAPYGIGYLFPALGIAFFVTGVVFAVRYYRGTPEKSRYKPPKNWIVDETPENADLKNEAASIHAGVNKSKEATGKEPR